MITCAKEISQCTFIFISLAEVISFMLHYLKKNKAALLKNSNIQSIYGSSVTFLPKQPKKKKE